MKFELTPTNPGVPLVYPEAVWWEHTLHYALGGRWEPALPVPTHLAGGMPWETYRPGCCLTAADAEAMAAGLEHWRATLKPQYTSVRVATDPEITSRVEFAGWLRQAGDVMIHHNQTWRPDRLTGASGVRLTAAAGEAVELTPEVFYRLLADAVAGGWVPARAENDEHPSDSIYRGDAYDIPGAVIGDPDAEQMVAALRQLHTMIALGSALIPAEPLRTFARTAELHQTGKRRGGAGWIRVQVMR